MTQQWYFPHVLKRLTFYWLILQGYELLHHPTPGWFYYFSYGILAKMILILYILNSSLTVARAEIKIEYKLCSFKYDERWIIIFATGVNWNSNVIRKAFRVTSGHQWLRNTQWGVHVCAINYLLDTRPCALAGRPVVPELSKWFNENRIFVYYTKIMEFHLITIVT